MASLLEKAQNVIIVDKRSKPIDQRKNLDQCELAMAVIDGRVSAVQAAKALDLTRTRAEIILRNAIFNALKEGMATITFKNDTAENTNGE